jgi:hypothetical protein
VSFAEILRNIATAAMPLLVDGFKSLEDSLAGLAESTSDIGALRASIEGMVGHLKSWLDLFGAVGRAIANFATAAAPAGEEMVEWLTDGANKIADFLASASGKNSVADFFADTMPLAKQLIGLVGDVGEVFVEFSQAVAPVLAPVVGVIRDVLNVISDLLRVVQDLPGPLAAIAGALLAFGPAMAILGALKWIFSPITKGIVGLSTALGAGGLLARLSVLAPMFLSLLGPLAAVAAAIYLFTENIDLADDVAREVTNTVDGTAFAVANLANDVKAFASSMTVAGKSAKTMIGNVRNIAGAAQAAADAAIKGLGGVPAAFRSYGNRATLAFANGITSNTKAVAEAATRTARQAAQAARAQQHLYTGVGKILGQATARALSATAGAVSASGKRAAQGGVRGARSQSGSFTAAGRALGSNAANGLQAGGVAMAVAAIAAATAARARLIGMAASFQASGVAMGNAVAAGIRSTVGAVAAAASAVAAAARAQFPGSEPKDPSSPLRNLGAAGRATVENYIKGLDAALVAKSMRRTLGPARREIGRSVGGAQTERESLRAVLEGIDFGPNISVEPLAAMPDGRTLGIIGGLATAGQARQAHRIGSRRTIHG